MLVIKGDSNDAANPSIRLKDGTDTREAWISNSAGDLVLVNGGNDNVPHCKITLFDGNIIRFDTANTERARIDANGRLIVGHNANFARGQVQAIDAGGGEITVGRNDTTVTDGDDLGHYFFASNDDGTAIAVANISCFADADHTSTSAPVSMRFSVTPTGAVAPAEAMRLEEDGRLLVGTTASDMVEQHHRRWLCLDDGGINASASGENVFNFNRSNGDGTIGSFRSQGNSEGSVSISGSTCSFNGGHLSRWTQLAGGAARTEILRGSVLSNLDEMCVWSHAAVPDVLYTAEDELPDGVEVGDVKTAGRAAYTEDNEQLNRMKVSDVEGDPNVAGVFQCWDDGDDEASPMTFLCNDG